MSQGISFEILLYIIDVCYIYNENEVCRIYISFTGNLKRIQIHIDLWATSFNVHFNDITKLMCFVDIHSQMLSRENGVRSIYCSSTHINKRHYPLAVIVKIALYKTGIGF